jgi:hypothetical protein
MICWHPSPARPGENIALAWAVESNLVVGNINGPAGSPVAFPRVFTPALPACLPYCVLSWQSYPSLLTRQLIRPYQVKVLFEWTAASASFQARDTASVVSHQ